MEENLFKKTEYALYNYKNLGIKIKSIEIDIEMLKNDITLRAINYDEKVGPTHAFTSQVENEVIRRDEKVKEQIEQLEKDKYLFKQREGKISLALDSLSKEDRKLIELSYFSKPKSSWTKISEEMNIDKDRCCKIRNKLINELSYYIFNI